MNAGTLELHDEIGQVLTGLKLALEMGARLPAEEVGENLNQARVLVNELMARARKLSLDLRPAMWHIENYTAQTQIRVYFRHGGIEGKRFAPEVETAAYRIVQEVLTNVARHADVNEVNVQLWIQKQSICIEVEDQGRGFDVEAALTSSDNSGLTGMRERTTLLDGQLRIGSEIGKGTHLSAQLSVAEPLDR